MVARKKKRQRRLREALETVWGVGVPKYGRYPFKELEWYAKQWKNKKKKEMNLRFDGAVARAVNKQALSNNPYVHGTIEHREWQAGWREAKRLGDNRSSIYGRSLPEK